MTQRVPKTFTVAFRTAKLIQAFPRQSRAIDAAVEMITETVRSMPDLLCNVPPDTLDRVALHSTNSDIPSIIAKQLVIESSITDEHPLILALQNEITGLYALFALRMYFHAVETGVFEWGTTSILSDVSQKIEA
jgi:hypothetical protein